MHMHKAWEYIRHNRTALFDWLVVGCSFGLGFIYPTISDFIRSAWFSYWMLGALFLYMVGALLKHAPLSYRLRKNGNHQPVPYIIFLLVGHWFIMLFAIVLSEQAFRQLLRLPPLTEKNTASGELVTISIAGAAYLTWLVYRSKRAGKGVGTKNENALFRRELLADLFLVTAVAVFTFVFWEKGAMAMLERSPRQGIGDIWFLFVFLAILYLFFYLPLRYLFFIENRGGSGNSRRLLLIFGFMLLRALFEMLRI